MKQHIRISLRIILLALCISLIPGQSAYAGKLDDFEREATHDDDNASQGYRPATDDDDDDGFWSAIFRGVFRIIFWSDGDDDSYRDDHSRIQPEPRRGEPQIETFMPPAYNPLLRPSLRLDGAYQNVQSDVRALDLRAEGGFNLLAVQGRMTYYHEEEPDDGLWLNSVHGLLRGALGRHLSLGFGAGAVILDGNNRNSGFSMTLPILVYPQESIGIEFRPTWSWIEGNTINDYDASLVLGSRHAAFRAGYRWVSVEDESLEGVYMGVTFRF